MGITYRIGHDGRLSVQEMDDNFHYIDSFLTDLDSTVSNLSSLEAGLSASLSALAVLENLDVTGLSASLSALADLEHLDIAGLTASVLNLENNVASATASILVIENEITGLTASVLTLTTNLASATASLSALSVLENLDVAGLTASILTLNNNVASATASILTLENNLTSATASILTLNNNVASATASIAAINVIRNEFYVYPSFSGTSTGSKSAPYTTIAAALAAAYSAGYNDSNPAFIILISSITENVTMTNGGIWLTSDFGTGTHGSVIVNGSITINGNAGTISENHFSISNLRIVPASNGYGINFTGTNPQRLYMRDLWIDASGTTGACVYADNSGANSVCHLNTAHLTHTGTGDVYCFDAEKGGMYLTDIETSGTNVQVAKIGSGAILTLDSSELDASGDSAIECYGSGAVVVTRSTINNTKSGGNGISLNGTQSIATVGDCLFNIDNYLGAGKAVYGVTGSSLYYQYVTFFPFSNTKKSAGIIAATLSTSFT